MQAGAHPVGLSLFNYQDDAGSNKLKALQYLKTLLDVN